MIYCVGDYLVVLLVNFKESINWVMRKFGLVWDSYIMVVGGVEGKKMMFLIGVLVLVYEVFGFYVELL